METLRGRVERVIGEIIWSMTFLLYFMPGLYFGVIDVGIYLLSGVNWVYGEAG